MSLPPEIRLTPTALQLLRNYYQQYPQRLESERKSTGADPLTNPGYYFGIELQEPNHHDVLIAVRRDNSTLTAVTIQQWIQEEGIQYSGRKAMFTHVLNPGESISFLQPVNSIKNVSNVDLYVERKGNLVEINSTGYSS